MENILMLDSKEFIGREGINCIYLNEFYDSLNTKNPLKFVNKVLKSTKIDGIAIKGSYVSPMSFFLLGYTESWLYFNYGITNIKEYRYAYRSILGRTLNIFSHGSNYHIAKYNNKTNSYITYKHVNSVISDPAIKYGLLDKYKVNHGILINVILNNKDYYQVGFDRYATGNGYFMNFHKAYNGELDKVASYLGEFKIEVAKDNS